MRVQSNPQGVIKQIFFFEKKDVDNMCSDALKQAGLLPAQPEPIRIERFIEKHFQCRVVHGGLPEGALGCTVFKPSGAVEAVFVSESFGDGGVVGRRVLRSTLAHEGGHGLMHASLFMDDGRQGRFDQAAEIENLDFKKRRILCRDSDFRDRAQKRYDGRWWEYQANMAIGGFLLPRRLVTLALSPYLAKSGGLGLERLPHERVEEAKRALADVFDVNPAVVGIRLGEMFPDLNQPDL